jgi:hypothetical protein
MLFYVTFTFSDQIEEETAEFNNKPLNKIMPLGESWQR